MEKVKKGKPLMIQGTHSDAGKSMIATAFCRIFKEDGYQTAPFKSQNMALNSYITMDGKEIGRAQGIQAEAAGVEATTNMNPILIKPTRDHESQIVVHGKPLRNMFAFQYRQEFFNEGLNVITESYKELANHYDRIVIEGAGSPAEVNLNDRELVNMRVAKIAQAPVVLVGDIDKGGVFASLVGTLQLLPDEHKPRVIGVLINKFRGDLELLKPGLKWFEEYTGVPVLGVIPYMHDVEIDAEDSLSLRNYSTLVNPLKEIDIAVISYPRISNFTDIDPLSLEEDCHVRLVTKPSQLGTPDLIVLPGSKNTIEDAQFLQESGLALAINQVLNATNAHVIGICGGYQMLGETITDPDAVESRIESIKGLGLLPVETVMTTSKKTERVSGYVQLKGERVSIEGYEIHMGKTVSKSATEAFAVVEHEKEGTVKDNVIGTYVHDVFHNDSLRRALLNQIRKHKKLPPITDTFNSRLQKEESFSKAAAYVREAIDMEKLYHLIDNYKSPEQAQKV
ncbi:cobyric acid synthase [Priestia sp. P5]|uniref:cobyric acid synthase n=1 Tax=Priestia sp. P5 TaxID=2917806 RepID=UPI0024053D3D|nr:cobyric acid synthase [Priestia sp. P5]MDG0058926.1 cobyric acid synthase [Priestia sp. P5]